MSAQKSLSNLDSGPDNFEPDLQRALELAMRMLVIPGKSGEERKVAAFIADQLRAAGAPAAAIQTDRAHLATPTPSDTGNLILQLPGTREGPRRLLSAHMDTVPICVGCQPVIEGRTVHAAEPTTGLGGDDRAGATVILSAALEILERELPHPPLTFCWFIQEEVGMQGAHHVDRAALGDPKLAFNWDGSSAVAMCVGATGAYHITIRVEGLASHAGVAPEAGVSAIAIAARAIADLDRAGWHGKVEKDGHQGTSNIGFIEGGEATNVVTDRVNIRAEARSHDAEFRKRMLREIEQAFQTAATDVQSADGVQGKVFVESTLAYESFQLDADEPSVLVAEAAARAIGREPQRTVVNGGLDANWLTAHGIPSVTMGCGQQNPHTVHETLNLDEFEAACRVALRLALGAETQE